MENGTKVNYVIILGSIREYKEYVYLQKRYLNLDVEYIYASNIEKIRGIRIAQVVILHGWEEHIKVYRELNRRGII